MPKRVLAFLQVLLVIAFWSSSPPLIKLALRDLEAQEIAAMRYFGAFLVLLPWLLTRSRSTLQSLDGKAWLKLTLMGILGFTVGNTALFLGLKTLNATTGAFLMNGIPLITLILGAILLKEHPGHLQWLGVAVALAGGVIYFWGNVELNQREGVLWLVVAVVSLASYGLFGRSMAKGRGADPIILTAIPMGIGAGLLLALDWPSSLPSGATLEATDLVVADLEKRLEDIEEKQDIVEKELDALQKRIKHLSEERRELDKINATIRSLLEEIEEGEKSLVEKSKELEEIKHVSFEKDEYERKIIEKNKVYEEYQLVLEEYNNKKDENNRLKLELEKARGNKKVLEQKIGSIKEQVDNLERIKKRIGDETADLEYLQLLVDIMSSFRTDLISRIRPMLSAYASEFFERLTDGKYKLIELDEDYNIKILDDGRAYGIKRFSGGEEDLANLCLRLAISEIVSERADRQFNFIILDEIFGSQDSIRRQNIMQALNALSSKFRQIFLITHIEDIKNFMENVIHVIENEDGTSYVKVD